MGKRNRRRDPEALPMDQWTRTVGAALRKVVTDTGQIPGIIAFASIGDDPKRLEVLGHARLNMLEHTHAINTYIADRMVARRSWYAAYGRLVIAEHRFILVAVDADRIRKRMAPVDERTGLGAWSDGEFRAGDFDWAQRTIREVRDA